MKRRFDQLIAIGAAGAVLASALAAAQTPKGEVVPEAARRPRVIMKTKKPAPVEAPAAEAIFLPAPPAVLNGIGAVEQLTERCRPYLWVEYHFLRMVCALSEDERKPIAREVERVYKDVMERYEGMLRSGQLRRAGQALQALPDPRKLIEEGVARVADEHLSAAQAARYRAELALRASDRKRITIQRVVEKLDQDLILSSEQRTRLTETLISSWDETWFPTEYMMMNPERYVSRIPLKHLLPLLDEDQKELRTQAIRYPVNAANFVTGPVSIPSEFPEAEELAEARKAEAAKHAEVAP